MEKLKLKVCLKFIIKFILLSIMCYQILMVSLNYFSYPYYIKLHLNDDINKRLPTITLCFFQNPQCIYHSANNSSNNSRFKLNYNNLPKTLTKEFIQCSLRLSESNESIDCEMISQVSHSFLFIYHVPFKCFSYFNTNDRNTTIDNNMSFNRINLLLNKTLLRTNKCTDYG